MNIGMRSGSRTLGRKFPFAGVMVMLVPLAVIVLGVVSWQDAGVQPVEEQTISVPVPDLPKGEQPQSATEKSAPASSAQVKGAAQ